MRKEEKITYSLIAAIFAVAFLFVYVLLPHQEQISFSPITTNLNQTCTNSSIQNLWDSIFLETSEGINISIENQSCMSTVVYKIKNNTDLFILSIYKTSNTTGIISASHGITNENYFSRINLQEIRDISLNERYFQEANFSSRARSLNYSELENESKKYFKENNLNLTSTIEEINSRGFGLLTTKDSYRGSETNVSLIVFTNVSLERARIYLSQTGFVCAPNWTEQKTTCLNETRTTYYIDSESCNNQTGKPENKTENCDSDMNGIIATKANITQRNFNNLIVKINNSELNISRNYTEELKVEILNNQTKVLEFNWNFSTPLDLTKIFIEISNTTYPYIIINGINTSKKIYLPATSYDTFCIKDSYSANISQISSTCNKSGETKLYCPGSTSRFNCSLINNNTYSITGLEHSAVKGIIESSSCNPSWNCANWSSCINGIKTRTCTDRNSCAVLAGKPATTENCSNQITSGCTPNWRCSNWTECSEEGIITRNCTDTNRCPIPTSESPLTEDSCTYKKTETNAVLILQIALIVLIATLAIIILVLYNKKEETPYYAPKPTYYR